MISFSFACFLVQSALLRLLCRRGFGSFFLFLYKPILSTPLSYLCSFKCPHLLFKPFLYQSPSASPCANHSYSGFDKPLALGLSMWNISFPESLSKVVSSLSSLENGILIFIKEFFFFSNVETMNLMRIKIKNVRCSKISIKPETTTISDIPLNLNFRETVCLLPGSSSCPASIPLGGSG